MRASRMILALLVLPAAASAQDRGRAPTVEVQLSNFDYAPRTLRLRAGEPVVLRLVSASSGGHNFSAPQFFAAARIVDAGGLHEGAVEVPGRQAREVRLVPARGRYRLRCTHRFHTLLGMSGEIVVE